MDPDSERAYAARPSAVPAILANFCAGQRDSHKALRKSDPKYAEYHRGAAVAYGIMLRYPGGEFPATARAVRKVVGEEEEAESDCSAWRGEPPAEGTRRELILDAIKRVFAGRVFPTDPERALAGSETLFREIADAVEAALLEVDHCDDTCQDSCDDAPSVLDDIDLIGVARHELMNRIVSGGLASEELVFLVARLG